ncbi:MAG: WD40 repeat domain-containing protein [Gemmataceae bacterium]|nr:WD40 repeat domain-containing protein [Gemmataceae bacterium]
MSGVVFTKDGERIISSSEDKTVRLWDVKTRRERGQYQGSKEPVVFLTISPDGSRLCGGGVQHWNVWEVESRRSLYSLQQNGKESLIKSAVYTSPDGHKLALGFSAGLIQKFAFDANRFSWTAVGYGRSSINAVCHAKDGLVVAGACADGSVRLFSLEKFEEARQLTGHTGEAFAVAISPDGRVLVSGGADKTIRVWNPSTGQMTRLIKGHTGAVTSVAISPDGTRILSGSEDRSVRLWDAQTGKEIHNYEGHTDSVACIAVSPNGRIGVSGGSDSTLRLWDLSK